MFGGIAMVLFNFGGSALAAEPFRLTSTFDIGGGGCIGETRIYEESTVAAERSAGGAQRRIGAKSAVVPWAEVDRRLTSRARYFLITVGCGADRVAISIDGKAYLLEAYRVETIGEPITYFSDTTASPQVRVERLSTVHAIEFKATECTQRFDKVRVRIEFNGTRSVVQGIAINSCP